MRKYHFTKNPRGTVVVAIGQRLYLRQMDATGKPCPIEELENPLYVAPDKRLRVLAADDVPLEKVLEMIDQLR